MLDPSQFLTPKPGMTSVEAAEAFLAAEEKETYERTHTFDLDLLARSGIARSVGFNFDLTVDYDRKRFILVDRSTGYKTTAFYTELDEKAIKRLVRALGRLKKAHEAIMMEQKHR